MNIYSKNISDLLRSTMITHMKFLEADSLVTNQLLLRNKEGRPKTFYKPSPHLLKMIKTISD